MEYFGNILTESLLNETNVKALLTSSEKFDVIIMEEFVNQAFRGFCHHFKAHCIVVSTIGQSRWTNIQMGNLNPPSYVPENSLTYTSKMNFFERLMNTYAFAIATLVFNFYTLPTHNRFLQKYFPGAPHISELYYNTSLMLLNSHVSINPALPNVPNMINIGGYHVSPPKQLPKDLQEYLDNAKEGAIYFSLGSHIDPKMMPKEKLNAILKVFAKLKQKILWKYSEEVLPGKSNNVKILKWLPQSEILAHPNVVLFISHGGLLSTIETIYHGKPVVGIPILGDQEMNIANAESNGFAKTMPFTELTEEKFEHVINEVLYNPKYAENAKWRSKIMHDEPMKPLEKAMFWIEYVLRHNGARHLRTAALDLYWYQMLGLDVLAFTLIFYSILQSVRWYRFFLKPTMNFQYLACTFFLYQYAYSAKILGIFHGATYSHQQLGSKLLYELARRGHEVTTIVPKQFAPKTSIKNFKTVEMDFDMTATDNFPNPFSMTNMGFITKTIFMEKFGEMLTESLLNETNVKALLTSNEKFDIIVMEEFVNQAFRGFCHHFKAHCIVVSTIGQSRWTNIQMGNLNPPSYVPENSLTYTSKMNFFERLMNTYAFAIATLVFNFYTLPTHNRFLQKYFPGAPHISELYYNTSLMLLNSHVSINPALPNVPNMINIGGYHVSPPKQLPKDLQEYLDNAKEGAIYFSLGSHIDPKMMPKEKLNAILKVFAKLKQKILWKYSEEVLPGKSNNVKILKWLPQSEILAHPNVVLFISHGGLLSTIETIYHGKPVVGIPILGDQEMNIANAESNGFAKAMPFTELTEEKFEHVINEVLYNLKYAENAKWRSKIMHDEPMKPLEKAMFWIEYVLRHNGARHLRTAALDLYWYQMLGLDVLAFTLIVIAGVAWYLCKYFKFVFGKKTSTKSQKQDPYGSKKRREEKEKKTPATLDRHDRKHVAKKRENHRKSEEICEK
ncbi:hypothetical protein FQA39_LY02627 [Lamprigera yunnana]|nr:hypothetical protein FQA39_LY02627 [Lamprigera yunnana]